MKTVLRSVIPLLLCAVLLALTGCSPIDFFSADSLLRAPKLTGRNAALQQAFEAAVGKDVLLVSPLTGEHRSAYILRDCNGDKVEEAFVFYVRQGAESTIHIHLLEFSENGWYSSADVPGNGSEIYKVEFFNIDKDRAQELAVTWTVTDSKRDKTLSLYKIGYSSAGQQGEINPLASVQVFDYFVSDFDRDGQNELFYVYFDSTEEKNGAYAKMLKYSETDTVLYPVNEVKFDGRASNLLSVKYDYGDGCYEFFADCAVGENAYYTELILYDPGTAALSLPVRALYEDPVAQTRRAAPLYAEDIDGDGRIEIPAERAMDGSFMVNYPDSESVPLRCVSWLRYSQDGFAPTVSYYVNDVNAYRVKLDPALGPLYIISDYMTGAVQFRRAEPSYGTGADPYDEEDDGRDDYDNDYENDYEIDYENGYGSDDDGDHGEPEETTVLAVNGEADDLLFTLFPENKEPEQRGPGAAIPVRIEITDLGRSLGITKKTVESLIETGDWTASA